MSGLTQLSLHIDTIGIDAYQNLGIPPAGLVAGIAVPGFASTESYRDGPHTVEVAVGMDAQVALDIFASFVRHQRHASSTAESEHRARCWNNCLTFLAESQGWDVTTAEQFPDGVEPYLPEGYFDRVDDIQDLEPGAPYALRSARGRVVHGLVGTALRNRSLQVQGTTARGNAGLLLAPTRYVMTALARFKPQLVRLHGQDYVPLERGPVKLC